MKEKQKVYLCVGLPASGKSTWAKELVYNSNGRVKRVNMDSLREMLDESKWSKEREKFARNIHNQIVEQVVKDGYSVVIDNTSFSEKHQNWTRELATKYDCEFVLKFFDTPLLTCIERDASRGARAVGKQVIYRMYDTYLRKENPSDQTKDKIFVFDMDGTLATMCDRSPYDLSKVKGDAVNKSVFTAYDALKKAGYKIAIFTGREGICEADTKEWLADNGIEYDHFEMRAIGDIRSDDIVKFEFFERIKDNYNVMGIFDDRESVVQMWRAIGVPCFQVDWGMF